VRSFPAAERDKSLLSKQNGRFVMIASTVAALVVAVSNVSAAVNPAIARRDGRVEVTVSGLPAAVAGVRIEGGLASLGHWFGWIPLQSSGSGSWHTLLRAPGYLGVYPVQVRAKRHVYDTGTQVRILPRGFAAQTGFFSPKEVADWWVKTTVPSGTLLSVATVHHGFYTHRDPDLNLLLKVHFQNGRVKQVKYLSIARLSASAAWRLLEVVEAP
jgi:hypothetical protein